MPTSQGNLPEMEKDIKILLENLDLQNCFRRILRISG